MTIATALRKAETSPADAELLLAHILGKDRTWLLAHSEEPLSRENETRFIACVARRKNHEPVAYITGQKEFYGRNFHVDRRVLIPRPATEVLIDEVKRIEKAYWYTGIPLQTHHTTDADTDIIILTQVFPKKLKPNTYSLSQNRNNPPITILDIGTGSALRQAPSFARLRKGRQDRWGHPSNPDLVFVDVGCGSGCIGITLALEYPDVKVICTDISEGALEVARENAKRHGVLDRISFQKARRASWFDPSARLGTGLAHHDVGGGVYPEWSRRAPHDILVPFLVVSNPPYVPSGNPLPPDILDYEPHEALFAGPDGMDVLRPLMQQCREHPQCIGCVLECRAEQAQTLSRMIR